MGKNNIILITIDELTINALGIGGNVPTPSKTIDELYYNGFSLENCFSAGSVTQFAMPSLFTSTYPLDYRGYDQGITNRPYSFPELLQENGYTTIASVSAWWQDRLYQYDRGFDHFTAAFPVSMYVNGIAIYLNYYSNLYENRGCLSDEQIKFVYDMCDRLISRIDEYCTEKINEIDSEMITSSSIHRWDFKTMRSILQKYRQSIGEKKSKKQFVRSVLTREDQYLNELLNKKERIDNEIDCPPTIRFLSLFSSIKGSVPLFSSYLPNKLNHLYRALKDIGGHSIHKRTMPSRTPSAEYLLNKTVTKLSNNVDNQPFFIWTHLMDVHELNFVSWDMNQPELVETEISSAKKFLYQSIKSNQNFSNPFYDLSVQYVDNCLARFLNSLRLLDLLKNTIIIITADHGSYTSCKPPRAKKDITDFYDERYHIPCIIYGDGIPETTADGLYSAVDIPPTILDCAEIESPSAFKGSSIFEMNGREYILMEHLGQGPCDFESKNINISVRDKSRKIVCRGNQLSEYYRVSDGQEYDNLVGGNGNEFADLRSIVQNRRNDIIRQ